MRCWGGSTAFIEVAYGCGEAKELQAEENEYLL